jgi:multiple sugar transport system ATP-binding protein
MAHLKFDHINKIYPNGVQAVFDFDMEIDDKEFIVLVGPSGCGKSTILRMIAGLESITSGELTIDGVRVNEKPPVNRDIAMIFQDYALYGNMTVYENMGFSLTVRKIGTDEVHDRVMRVSEIVELDHQLNRYPKNLSGGQRQRVALGRSIVRNAKVFLMDEPLSNLDAKLRAQTRREIILLHHKLQTNIIYVTHDQTEAMTMATRMIVMNDGRIQQIGTPFEIYNNPINMFVASFIGNPPMNFIRGEIIDGFFVKENIRLELCEIDKQKFSTNRKIIIGIRPENIKVSPKDFLLYPNSIITAKIDISELLGSTTILCFEVDSELFRASVDTDHLKYMNQFPQFAIEMDKVHFFDTETELTLKQVKNS